MPPAVGRCRASCPMDSAVHRQPAKAITTPADSAPPANNAPTVIEKAAPAAGAIVVIDVKITSGSPTASRRSPSAGRSVSCSAVIPHPPLTVTRPTRPTVLRRAQPCLAQWPAAEYGSGLLCGPLGRSIGLPITRCQDHAASRFPAEAPRRLLLRPAGGRDPDQVGPGNLNVRGHVTLCRLRIPALYRVQDLTVMQLRGPEYVLGHLVHGHPEESARVRDGALHPVVPCRPGYSLVECRIRGPEPPGFSAAGHCRECRPQAGQVVVGAADGGQPGRAALDRQPEVDGLLDLRQPRADNLREPVLGLGPVQHDDAAASTPPRLHVALALQHADGLANAGPGDAELLGQLALGRELVTGNERAAVNGTPQLIHDQAVDRDVLNALNPGRGWARC